MRKIITPIFCAILAIALASSLIVLWQTGRITPLIDYSYQVENAFRIFKGEMPYRDFFLVVSPGTYYVMALLMYLTGGYSHMVQVYFVMMVAFFTVMCTYAVLRVLNKDNRFIIVLLAPLLFSGQSVYPYPLYDPNVALSMLIAVFTLLYIRKKKIHSDRWNLVAGMLTAIPALFKQNIGAVFFVSIVCVFAVVTFLERKRKGAHQFFVFVFGSSLIYSFFSFWVITNKAFDQFIYQIFTFPSFAKNPIAGLQIIIDQYKSYWTFFSDNKVTIGIFLGLILTVLAISRATIQERKKKVVIFFGNTLTALFIFFVLVRSYISSDPLSFHNTYILASWVTITVLSLACCIYQIFSKNSKKDFLYILLPIILIVSSHATFLSHGVIGSSYHMWPLAAILLGYIVWNLEYVAPAVAWKFLCTVPLIFLTILLGQAVTSDYAMGYIDHTGLASQSRLKPLVGLSVSGPWIHEFESMVSYVQQVIPMSDIVAFLPGEDPFFAVTNRKNPLKFSLLHASVYSLQPSLVIPELLEKKVDWIVVKKKYQTHPWLWISNIDQITFYVRQHYEIVKILPNYDIYKRL